MGIRNKKTLSWIEVIVNHKNGYAYHCFEFLNEKQRNEYPYFTINDIGKIAKQIDNGTFWMLSSLSDAKEE